MFDPNPLNEDEKGDILERVRWWAALREASNARQLLMGCKTPAEVVASEKRAEWIPLTLQYGPDGGANSSQYRELTTMEKAALVDWWPWTELRPCPSNTRCCCRRLGRASACAARYSAWTSASGFRQARTSVRSDSCCAPRGQPKRCRRSPVGAGHAAGSSRGKTILNLGS